MHSAIIENFKFKEGLINIVSLSFENSKLFDGYAAIIINKFITIHVYMSGMQSLRGYVFWLKEACQKFAKWDFAPRRAVIHK
jgi:hypothetical protein